jgi:hypothetical protein
MFMNISKIIRGELFFVVIGWVLTISSLLLLYQQGILRSYFHQDDIPELSVVADWKGWNTLGSLNNEHLIITFWPLLRLQWLLFGINFAPYLTLNILFHIIVLCLIFVIVYKLTKSFVWASLPVWGMVINPNWFAVVWWITGQMIFLATIFALLSYWVVLLIRDKPKIFLLYPLLYLLSILPGLSWGVGLTWPVWPLLVFGVDYQNRRINSTGRVLIAAQVTLVMIYLSLVGNSLGFNSDPKMWLSNPFGIVSFALVGISNTLVGRWLWPLENLEIRVICLLVMLLILFALKPLKKINRDGFFGFLVVVGIFMTIAIPRWRFGIGQAMANYYAYFPLPFLLISVSVFFYRLKLKGIKMMIILFVFLLHIPLSWIGFEDWAHEWVIRPQQTKQYFLMLDYMIPGQCIKNEYLPRYIIPQNIWRVDFLWPVFKKDWSPFCD